MATGHEMPFRLSAFDKEIKEINGARESKELVGWPRLTEWGF